MFWWKFPRGYLSESVTNIPPRYSPLLRPGATDRQPPAALRGKLADVPVTG